MADESPTLMVLYDIGSSKPQRVAEFRLTPAGRVALAVIDPAGCPLAEEWHDDGIETLGSAHRVTPDDGHAFMRALVQLFEMSYYRLVDESVGESRNPATSSPWAKIVQQGAHNASSANPS
ncbi:hypothetical protein [Nocardia sp. NPDC051463]|uniref:hypothetical protein n=1 Tax=Nocardia sp. NPDC051463 TaxID=3154845 RepID=UPI00344DB34E